jgi:signal transduction histidine kinase
MTVSENIKKNNKTKFRFDTRSLRFRLVAYLFLFAAIIMAMLWIMQVFFMNSYYQKAKTGETERTAYSISALYANSDTADLREQITNIYRTHDMYIEIQTSSGLKLYIPNIDMTEKENVTPAPTDDKKTGSSSSNSSDLNETTSADETTTPHLPPSVYQAEIGNLKEGLEKSKSGVISKRVTDPKTGLITLEYATYLGSKDEEDRKILFMFSPLYPMTTTVKLLTNQLFIVTAFAFILAAAVAIFLSRRISVPISSITKKAAKLGDGEYGITFDKSHYTEINKLAETLTYTSFELEKTDSLQKDVIANVSHDLRTPLTMITSYAEMIRDLSGDDPARRNEHLDIIIDEASSLNNLITDLLEVSRMQSGELKIELTEFSLKEMIETLLQSYAGFVEQEKYKLVFISRGEGIVYADQERIKQVMGNLISNAFKYGGIDRTIEVKMFEDGKKIRCEVSDHGIGIPKKDLRHGWERYYKASTNYQRSEHTGIGLSIVKEILLLHNANFGVNSVIRKGSTVWFELNKFEETPSAQISDPALDAGPTTPDSEEDNA